jgi:uncharacterized SAM-binding protein YcdF (DUF218 family)
LLKNEDIICISSIDWDFIWQGHQEIMSTLAASGNRVLYIENTGVRPPRIRDVSRIKSRLKNWFRGTGGIRKERENLYVFSPLILPFPYSRLVSWINSTMLMLVIRRWMKAMEFSDPVIWTFLPTDLSRSIIEALPKKVVVYYCIDNFSVSSPAAGKIVEPERRMIRSADLVFTTSTALYDYCSRYNACVYKFPFTVNYEKFEKVRLEDGPPPEELKSIAGPLVGYVGGIHKWMDMELLVEAARRCPDYRFVFVGPVQTDVSALEALGNVHFLGKKNHESLPALIKHFDVCIIPYVISEYTKNVYPTKLNEYLALGKHVVSTPLPELLEFNRTNGDVVEIAPDADGFVGAIKKCLDGKSGVTSERLSEIARKNGWEGRIEDMCVVIQDGIEKRKLQRSQWDWADRFRTTFFAYRRGLTLAALPLLLYYLVFSTQLAWYAAEPLKLEQQPRAADCIIVFAGGVGESGKAGEGYKERTLKAVNLFKKHYARHLIISSGYSDILQEANLMHGLAVELGVPKENIVLEKKAGNTYENVVFSFDIARRHGWKSALIVSSPYHMLRVKLVILKVGGGMEATYVPVENSRFFAHGEGITLEQLTAILHEYAGIAYYWWIGWI